MIAIFKKVIYWGEKIQMALGVIMLAAIIVSMTGGVISRYIFGSPFTWTEELGTFLFIWLSFLGAGIASAKKKHVVVDFLTEKIPVKYSNIVKLVLNFLIIVFLVLLAIGAVILQPKTSAHGSVALNIPKNFYYLPVLITSVYMFFIYVVETFELWQSMKKPQHNA